MTIDSYFFLTHIIDNHIISMKNIICNNVNLVCDGGVLRNEAPVFLFIIREGE